MRKSMKLRTTLLMSIALFVSLFVFAVSMQFAPKANADSTIFTNQQTQIRTKTQENGISGIRFTTTVDLTGSDISSDAEFGLLVAKTADLDGKALSFELENFDQVATKVPAGVFVTKTETSLVYQVVVAGIPASDYGTSITAVPYVIDGETTIVASSGQDHSIAEVASALIARGDENSDKLIGYVDGVTDENSLVVDVDNLSLKVEDTYELEVSVTPNYLVPVYASENEEIATVVNGVVTAVSAGSTNITVTLGSIVKTIEVTVKAEPKYDVLAKSSYSYIGIGQTFAEDFETAGKEKFLIEAKNSGDIVEVINDDDAINGSSIKITTGSQYGGILIKNSVQFESNFNYRIEFDYKMVQGNGALYLASAVQGGSGWTEKQISSSSLNVVYKASLDFTPNKTIWFRLMTGSSAQQVIVIDNVKITNMGTFTNLTTFEDGYTIGQNVVANENGNQLSLVSEDLPLCSAGTALKVSAGDCAYGFAGVYLHGYTFTEGAQYLVRFNVKILSGNTSLYVALGAGSDTLVNVYNGVAEVVVTAGSNTFMRIMANASSDASFVIDNVMVREGASLTKTVVTFNNGYELGKNIEASGSSTHSLVSEDLPTASTGIALKVVGNGADAYPGLVVTIVDKFESNANYKITAHVKVLQGTANFYIGKIMGSGNESAIAVSNEILSGTRDANGSGNTFRIMSSNDATKIYVIDYIVIEKVA